MSNITHKKERHCCLCILIFAFLFGSGVWLKLILSDVLSFDLSYDLLYEREYMKEDIGHWRVARGLNISADFSGATVKRPPLPPSRQLEEDWAFEDEALGAPANDPDEVNSSQVSKQQSFTHNINSGNCNGGKRKRRRSDHSLFLNRQRRRHQAAPSAGRRFAPRPD